jgi:ABC-type transport system involved in multi-copper enzyme maturation permease subunit
MLWYKSWLETRWRFLIGLALLMLSAAATVLTYPEVVKLLTLVPKADLSGPIGRRVAEAMELSRDYRGYLWSQWFVQKVPQLGTLFAVLLGSGGLLAQASGGAALFTLSLPVTRSRLLGIRTATGLLEWLALAFVPSLLLPLLSPAVGQSYGVAQALVHSACAFVAGAVFFSLAVLLSTVFSDVWRPPLIVLCAAFVLAVFELLFRELSRYSPLGVMSAEVYFRGGGLPWLGLVASAAVSAAALYAASRNLARQDF